VAPAQPFPTYFLIQREVHTDLLTFRRLVS
jgi:hypothetical protein